MATTIEEKIAALMAKADATSSAHEAAAFYAKAEELMIKYAVERANLPTGDTRAKLQEVVTMRIDYTGAKSRWAALGVNGAGLLCDASGLVRMAIYNRTQQVVLYGTESDCRHVRTLITACWRQAEASLAVWRLESSTYRQALDQRGYTGDATQLRNVINGYTYGFCSGAAEQIAATREQVVKETVGAELALRDVMDQVNRKLESLPKARNRRISIEQTAMADGQQAGRNAHLVEQVGR